MPRNADRELYSRPGVPSFLEDLYRGVVRWDLIAPFPEQDRDDAAAGAAAVTELAAFLSERVDPDEVDATGALPAGLLTELAGTGYSKLRAGPEVGGLGLSLPNTFRAVRAAAEHAMPVGLVLAVENAHGVGAYLPVLPPGPLRDDALDRVRRGVLSGTADTEPTGAHNSTRRTTAVPTADGAAFHLTGEKIHIGNAPVADVVVVSATVPEPGGDALRLFFVDADSPGFTVAAEHEFMGLRGFPNGKLVLDNVRVPRERMVVERSTGGRLTPVLTLLTVLGRLFLIVAPSLAVATQCLRAAGDFTARRRIDGRPLGEYDEIQRQLADSLADTYAIDTVVRWCVLAEEQRGVNALLEQLAAKNIGSLACWRVVDRTMSLLAAEGFETARSKAARGGPVLAVERLFRDARGLRISGGVDFQLDNWAGRIILSYQDDGAAGDPQPPRPVGLHGRNRRHAQAVEQHARTLVGVAGRLVARHRDDDEALAAERPVILLSQVVNDVLTMALVLARAASTGDPDEHCYADVFCTAAGHRVATGWEQLHAVGDPDAAGVTRRWLSGQRADPLTREPGPGPATGA